MACDLAVFDEYAAKFPNGTLHNASSVGTSLCLYGLVRLIQPCYVVEIGTWEGATSIWLARAVEENGRGRYVGYEIDPEKARLTHDVLSRAVPGGSWSVINTDPCEQPYIETDFVFMDHAKHLYGKALSKLAMPIGSYCTAHDTQAWPDSVRFYQFMKLSPEWEILNILQERGLMIARKIS